MAESTEPARMAALRALMGLGGFRRLLLVRYASQLGDGLFQVGSIGLLLFALDPYEATSAGEIAKVIAITALPFTVVGPMAGVFIDRWQRRRILAGSSTSRAVIIAITLPLVSVHLVGLEVGEPIYYGGLLVVLGVNRFFLATLGAVLPRVVPGGVLLPANAISSTGGSLVTLVGASAGGGVAALIGDEAGGPETVVAVAAALMVVSGLVALRFEQDTLGPDRPARGPALGAQLREAYGEMVAGLVDIRRARRAWAPMLVFGGLRFATVGASIAALLVIRNDFGGGSGAVGLFLAAFGAGVGIGAVLASVLDRLDVATHASMVRAASLLTGIAIIAVGPLLTEAAFMILSGLMGIGFGVVKVSADTLVQTALPDAVRGRLFAAYDVIINTAVISSGIVTALALTDASRTDDIMVSLGGGLIVLVLLGRRWLLRLPPPVDVETWAEAREVH